MNDTVSDMLTRIRNAYLARKEEVVVPYSRLNHRLASLLSRLRYLAQVKVEEKSGKKSLLLTLGYKNNLAAVTRLERVSKPGRRIYSTARRIPSALGGEGFVILSTPRGVLTDREAKRLGIGGEVLCRVW